MKDRENKTQAADAAEETPSTKDTQNETAKEREDTQGEEQLTLYRKPKRNGKYISRLGKDELDALQRRKSLFMYASTLLFAVSLFLKVEGRTRLSENRDLFALFTLYVLCEVALIVLTVVIAVLGRGAQKIGPELKERNVPRDGLDKHTFRSYECFNVLHIVMAAAEIAVSVYDFGVWGALNIAASVASAVFAFLSRQVLYKANAGNLEFLPSKDDEEESPPEKKTI